MSATTSRAVSPAIRALVPALVVGIALAGLLAIAPESRAAPAAPWFGPNVQVTALPAYTAYQPSIAVGASGTLYLAYAGWGGSTTQSDIFFSKSTDAARTWTSPVRVNNDGGGASQLEPSLFLSATEVIYIIWTDYRGGTADIYFSRSTDLGLSFSANVRANDVTTNFQIEPDVAVDSAGLVHAVWTDNRNLFSTGPDIYYANSTDGGLSFNPTLRVNNDATGVEQFRPAIAVGPDRSVYAVWDDPRNGGRGGDIYFSRSSNLGGTWAPNIFVNDDTGNVPQDNAAIAVNPAGSIFMTWSDSRNANIAPDIYATRSTNGGATFAANMKVNDESTAVWQGFPSVAAIEGKVQIAWTDSRNWGSSGFDVYTASSVDGVVWGSNMKVNDDTIPGNDQTLASVAVNPGGDVFATWSDERVTGQDVFAAALDVHRPTATNGGDRTIGQGTLVQFDGSASTDNLGISVYAWDFGAGTVQNGPAVPRAYLTPGVYTVTLTVSDYSGNVDSTVATVTVLDTEAPIALGAGDRIVDEDEPLFFDGSASTDNMGIVSYAWDFGDGGTSTEAAATNVYDRPGTYTATLSVRDAAGNADTAQMTVTVREVSPKASELLGMIQALQGLVATLEAVLVVLAIALAIIGYLTFSMWRRQRPPPGAPMGMQPPTPKHETPSAPSTEDLAPPI